VTDARPRKALVVGSRGNIGQPLVRHLKSLGYEVREVDIRPGARDGYLVGDINNPLDILPAFDWGPEVVFMLAAVVGREVSEQAAALTITANLSGLSNVLQLCLRSKSRIVFFSSSEIYGPQDDVMDEAKSIPHPNNRYALSKWLGEQLVEYEVRHQGLKAVILRPFTIYDENEEPGDHRSAMIRFAWHLAYGRPISVHRGSARGWLHISDAVRAIEAAGRLKDYAVINIGHPAIVPTTELAEMIRRALDADESLVRVTELPPRMTLIKQPRLERQASLLNFIPAVRLAEGVGLVCAFQKALRDAVGDRAIGG
jgi:nucleoside-diphosphate-sugar epimerase